MPWHPDPERVAVAWLKTVLSPFTGVATSAPALESWPVLDASAPKVRAFVVVDGVVGGSTGETRLRRPVVSVSAWAAALNSDNPPWGAASEVMSRIVDKVFTGGVHTLSWDGYASARVSSAWLVSPEPRRIPDMDNSGRAHYVLDIALAWTEVSA